MRLFHGSIRKKLTVLVLLATLPVFLVILGTAFQNRHDAVIRAEKETALYLSGFAEIQRRITNSTQTLLRTIGSIPAVVEMDENRAQVVLASLLETNPIYTNAILVDINGGVVAAGKSHDAAKKLNFKDRKQFKDAILSKGFASGEVVVGKTTLKPIFPFGMAVLNKQGEPIGVLLIGLSLTYYGELFQRGNYPLDSFFGVCDHSGLRLFRYPDNDFSTVGQPIQKKVFSTAVAHGRKGLLSAITSDGKRRLVAYEPLRLEGDNTAPYMYMFMGVEVSQLQEQGSSVLYRLLIAGLLSLALALGIAWLIGGRSVVRLIERLSLMTQRFSQGEMPVASHIDYSDGEIGELARSFDNMVQLIHQREQEKDSLMSQLAQAQKMDAIGQLAGGISHDFNNMLGGILGAGEMLSQYLPDDPKAKKFHHIIMLSATRAADLTGKLLALSHSSKKASTSVAVHNVINETITILENTTDRRIQIETNLNANPDFIVGDPSQLQSIFLNLGINAVHAMPNGGTLSISTGLIDIDEDFCRTSQFELLPGRFLEIIIKDTGCGIPEEALAKIFEPFYTTREKGKGTGLGLSTVYGMIKQHAGAILVESELNVGTRFQLLLPLSEELAAPASLAQEPISGKGTILIVDDEEPMRITAKAILEQLGYSVLLAENGGDAVALFQNGQTTIDLVILDMIMPVMNGRDCFFTLKQLDPQVRVILSSGFSREEDIEEMKQFGLKGFIRKPYLSHHLSQSVYDALQ